MRSCLALRMRSNVSYLNFLNLRHKSESFAPFALLYNHLRLRICPFMLVFRRIYLNHVFGMHCYVFCHGFAILSNILSFQTIINVFASVSHSFFAQRAKCYE